MEYTYDQMFQRNIGIFTPEEQERIKNFKVAIAGVGTLGGELAYLLTRLGIMNIRLCDPENFEISNINRQFGCYIDTIGENKATAVGKELLRINPKLNLDIWDYGVDETNANKFIEDCDVIVDAIDFYGIKNSISLQDEARKQNKWVMASQLVSSIASYINIKPRGPHFGDMFYENGEISMQKVISILFPVLPKEATPEMIKNVVDGNKIVIPSWSHAPAAIVLLLLEDMVNFFIKQKNLLLSAPSVTIMDLDKREFIIKNV